MSDQAGCSGRAAFILVPAFSTALKSFFFQPPCYLDPCHDDGILVLNFNIIQQAITVAIHTIEHGLHARVQFGFANLAILLVV